MKPGAVAGVAALAALALTGCASGTTHPAPVGHPAPAPAVALDIAARLPQPVRVGVIVTGNRVVGNGSQDLPLSAGSEVAAFRLSSAGKQSVTLDVVDDHGSVAGARRAVSRLLADHVAGIVDASEGSHVDGAVRQAAAAGTAVLLPYATDDSLARNGQIWLTGPSGDQLAATIRHRLRSRGASRPLVVAAADAPAAVRRLGATSLRLGAVGGAAGLAAALGRLNTSYDSVVVWGTPEAEAAVLARLEQRQVGVPVVLGPAALTSNFAAALGNQVRTGFAVVSTNFQTVGENATDATNTPAMAGFLDALRLAAVDPAVQARLRGTPYLGSRLSWADTRAHDAVVAIATAAAKAHSTQPAAVLAALRGLSLTAADGVAGAPLDFAHPTAAAPSEVVMLQATNHDLGQRDGLPSAAPALQWYALPAPR